VEREAPAPAAALPHRAPPQLPPAAELMAPLEQRLTAVEEAIISSSHRFSRERMLYAVVIGFLAGLTVIATVNVIFDPFRPAPATPAAAAVEPARAPAGASAGREGEAGSAAPTAPAAGQTPQAEAEAAPDVADVPTSAAVIGTRRTGSVAAPRGEYVVQVLVEVKDGRVADARVWNPRPGAGAYEAAALKMARERRYPESFSGAERLRIRVQP
jgi:hypothetical protein